MVDKSANRNKVYEDAVKLMIDESGDTRLNRHFTKDEEDAQRAWVDRIDQYTQQTDKTVGEVLDQIITEVIDRDGEPNIKFKEKLDLD
jgi:hypothetical protein